MLKLDTTLTSGSFTTGVEVHLTVDKASGLITYQRVRSLLSSSQ